MGLFSRLTWVSPRRRSPFPPPPFTNYAVTMHRSVVRVFVVITFAALTAFAGPVVNAQGVGSGQATVTVATPIFLYPDRNRTPLRVADAGLAVVIVKTEGDWYLVEFQDPQYGRRQGYIERRFVATTSSAKDATHDAKPSEPTPKATPAPAQAGGAPLRVQAFAAIDLNVFTASKTFKALFDSSTLPGYGGGVDVENVWSRLFVRVAVTQISKTGSRVFVTASDVFKLNEPAKLTLTPIEIGAGWRFQLRPPKRARSSNVSKLAPYIGGAALIESYKVDYSTSPDLNESETFKGGEVFGGVQYAVTKVLIVGGEAQYRLLPDALKTDLASSVASTYNEKQGGGFTGRITIGVRLGKK